jgi:hypothetical protein
LKSEEEEKEESKIMVVSGSGFRVEGSRLRVGFRVQGLGFKV